MKFGRITIGAILLIAGLFYGYSLPQDSNSVSAYESMLYPVVRISANGRTGSGVVIQRASAIYILTAAHVVAGSERAKVEFFSPTNYESSNYELPVLATDTTKDLALLGPIKERAKQKIYLARLAERNYRPIIFRDVIAVGCSLGLPPRPSEGIISAIDWFSWEISAPILPGNSGGAVFDERTKELIGITVWGRIYRQQLITTMAGVVPIGDIYSFLDNLDSPKGGEEK